MVNIIKEEISLEESLKKKIEFICEFAKVQPTIINGSIRKIDKTNLTYIEAHTFRNPSVQAVQIPYNIQWPAHILPV